MKKLEYRINENKVRYYIIEKCSTPVFVDWYISKMRNFHLKHWLTWYEELNEGQQKEADKIYKDNYIKDIKYNQYMVFLDNWDELVIKDSEYNITFF